MALNEERIASRKAAGLLVSVIIASVALGLIVWKGADLPFQSFFYTIFIVIGVYLIAMSFFSDSSMSYVPSDSSFYLVWGILLTLVGVLAFIDMLTDISMWVLVAIFILAFALLVGYRSISKKG